MFPANMELTGVRQPIPELPPVWRRRGSHLLIGLHLVSCSTHLQQSSLYLSESWEAGEKLGGWLREGEVRGEKPPTNVTEINKKLSTT